MFCDDHPSAHYWLNWVHGGGGPWGWLMMRLAWKKSHKTLLETADSEMGRVVTPDVSSNEWPWEEMKSMVVSTPSHFTTCRMRGDPPSMGILTRKWQGGGGGFCSYNIYTMEYDVYFSYKTTHTYCVLVHQYSRTKYIISIPFYLVIALINVTLVRIPPTLTGYVFHTLTLFTWTFVFQRIH